MSGNNLPDGAPGYIAGNLLIVRYENNGRHYYKVRGSDKPPADHLEGVVDSEEHRERTQPSELIWTGHALHLYGAEAEIRRALKEMGLQPDENRQAWLWTEDANINVHEVKATADRALQLDNQRWQPLPNTD